VVYFSDDIYKASNFNSVLRWALLRCGTYFDKIDQRGLKPILAEKRWLVAIIMTCKRTQSSCWVKPLPSALAQRYFLPSFVTNRRVFRKVH